MGSPFTRSQLDFVGDVVVNKSLHHVSERKISSRRIPNRAVLIGFVVRKFLGSSSKTELNGNTGL